MELALYLVQTGTIIAALVLTVRTRRQGELIDKLVAVLTEGEPRLFLEAPEEVGAIPKQEFETFMMTLQEFQYVAEREDFAMKFVTCMSAVQLHEVCKAGMHATNKAKLYAAWQKAKEGKKSWL